MRYQDILSQPRLSQLRVAPGGERLIVSVAAPTIDGKSIMRELTELGPDGVPTGRELGPRDGRADDAVFLSDGSLLLSGQTQSSTGSNSLRPGLWLLRPSAAEATPLASFNTPIVGMRAASTAMVAVIANYVYPGAESLEEDFASQSLRDEAGIQAVLFEEMPIRFWNHYVGPRYLHLFALQIDAVRESVIRLIDMTPHVGPRLEAMGFDILPDGSQLVCAQRSRSDPTRLADLVAIDLLSGASSVLTPGDAWYSDPVAGPNGHEVVCVRRSLGTPDSPTRRSLMLIDLASGGRESLAENVQGWPHAPSWSMDGRSIFFSAEDDGFECLYRVDLDSGAVENILRDGSFTSVTATDRGEIYALNSDFRMPQHVVRVSRGKAGYDVAPLWPDFQIANDRERIERCSAVAPDGSRVPYWLLTPAGATSTNPAPLVVFANAYVPFSWINQWYFRWNATAYTTQGYAVVLPDPAPSLGYGEAFLHRGWGRWIDTSLPDFLAAIDSAVKRPDIDGSRIAIIGGGWGGYLASLAATRSDRFSCIVVQGGCWDLPSYQGTTDEYDRWEEQLGDPYRDGERYLQLSPSTAVGSVKAPFLIFSGGIDYRAPSSDAIRMFRDLRRHGVDAKLVFMPEEGHRIGRLENERLWYETIFAYLDHHLRGRPWVPPRVL